MAIADRSFFQPTRQVYDWPDNYDLACEDVWFAGCGGPRLHGWFFPAARPRGTVVHCHGNAGNITAHFKFAAWLPACGWNLLCFDYRGFGRSEGKPSRAGVIADVHAALNYVQSRPDVEPESVAVFAQSLGGAVAIVALAEDGHGIAGLCIEGAFSSYRAEARFVTRQAWYLSGAAALIARLLIDDELSPIDHVARLPNVPKLFICGTDDRIVDYRQTIELYERAGEPKDLWVIDGSSHTEAATGQIEGGRQRILGFFNACVAAGEKCRMQNSE